MRVRLFEPITPADSARRVPMSFDDAGRALARRLLAQSIVCWWILGISFSGLWWLTNHHQLAWILFCYAWEVPAIGWTGVVLLPWLRWQAIGRSVAADDPYGASRLLRYPQFVALCALLTSSVGYVLGALQLIAFARLPVLEAVKVSVQGPILGAILSVGAFLEAERAIRRVTPAAALGSDAAAAHKRSTYTVAWKVRYITITIALGAATPILFFGLTREQRRLEELRGLALERVVAAYPAASARPGMVERLSSFGPHTALYAVAAPPRPEPAGVAAPFARARHASVVRLGDLGIDAPPKLFATREGWYASRFDGHRVVAFRYATPTPADQAAPSGPEPGEPLLLVAVSPLVDYGREMIASTLVAAGVGAVALAVAFLLSLSFARSIVEPLEAQSEEARALAERVAHANSELRSAVQGAESARREAEAANRSKSVFLANMSHELRTPLNAIRGYAELLALEVRGPVTAEQREDLRRIQRNERHLLSVIDDMLNFARLEAARITYASVDVPLADAVAMATTMLVPQFRATGIRLVVEPIYPECVARADVDKMRQVLVNLLSNALKFTEHGGTITVSATVEGESVAVRVRDTGRGIPPDMVEAIFEPFVQADSSLTRREQGSGLGLSISRGLIRGMLGELVVESTSAGGSVFRFTLPCAVTAGQPASIGA
jgi:signal transduction histidine kinase